MHFGEYTHQKPLLLLEIKWFMIERLVKNNLEQAPFKGETILLIGPR